MKENLSRRKFLGAVTAATVAGTAMAHHTNLTRTEESKPTEFQLACMTLPYSNFTLERALEGITRSGYEYVAWGTRHVNSAGNREPVLPLEATPSQARDLANRCRNLGLSPIMMFSRVYVASDNSVDGHKRRIDQANAAGISQVLTFGSTEPGERPLWIRNLSELGPYAEEAGVLLVVKQHGGETGTGELTARILREVNHPAIRMNYDAGNVLDYENVDPIEDIQTCADLIHSFCIKDHRNFPEDQDCGPGYGEIDHYRLLHPVAFSGRTMPLAFENIFAPLVSRPEDPGGVDALARRAREYIETVINGLHAVA